MVLRARALKYRACAPDLTGKKRGVGVPGQGSWGRLSERPFQKLPSRVSEKLVFEAGFAKTSIFHTFEADPPATRFHAPRPTQVYPHTPGVL